MHIIAIVLGIYHGANGLLMLAAPRLWYMLTPGVVSTGPLNEHFVRDIGLAFLAAAAGLLLAARREAYGLLVWPVAVFLGGHAVLHLVELAVHGAPVASALRDLALIVVPGLAPLALLRGPSRTWKEARS